MTEKKKPPHERQPRDAGGHFGVDPNQHYEPEKQLEHEQCRECGLMTEGRFSGRRFPLPPITYIDSRGSHRRGTNDRGRNVEPVICEDCQRKQNRKRLDALRKHFAQQQTEQLTRDMASLDPEQPQPEQRTRIVREHIERGGKD